MREGGEISTSGNSSFLRPGGVGLSFSELLAFDRSSDIMPAHGLQTLDHALPASVCDFISCGHNVALMVPGAMCSDRWHGLICM